MPIGAGILTLLVLLAAGVTHKTTALAMFCCAAFVLASVAQELWRGTRVRRAASQEAPPVALLALIRRNRRRYGGYIVHVGMAVLFVGVAASSSFQHVSKLALSPGQSTRVGSCTIRYVRPTASVSAHNDTVRTGSTLNVGAVLRVSKGGHYVATLHPSEGFYESQEESQGSVGRLIGGQPVSHVSMNARLTRDIWSAMSPEIESARLKRIVTIGNRTIPMSRPDEGMLAVWVLAHEYLRHPPPAQFNLLVSPLVMWIWIGGLIVFGGGLLALSPTPGSLRRRAAVRARARQLAADGARRPLAVGANGGVALAAGANPSEEAAAAADLAALEATREVKYRELRELELDYGTGKLAREDYEATGAALRAEALEILDRIEGLTGSDSASDAEAEAAGDAEVPAGVS